MDGTVNAGRKGIAYLRDIYRPPDTTRSDTAPAEVSDAERALVVATPET